MIRSGFSFPSVQVFSRLDNTFLFVGDRSRWTQSISNEVGDNHMINKLILTLVMLAASQASLAGKIVVFDPEEALMRTKLAQQKFEQLQAKPEFAQMMAQAESLRTDLEALSKEANSKGITWSADQKSEHRKKMEYVQADLKLAAQKIQAERAGVMQSLVGEMQPKLEQVLKSFIESEDIDLVLRKQVSFASKPAVDITIKIAQELDKAK